jgi:hypothetical protein
MNMAEAKADAAVGRTRITLIPSHGLGLLEVN